MNQEPAFRDLAEQLNRWENRRRLGQMFVWLPRGLLGGLLVTVAIAAVARFRPLLNNQELAYLAGGAAVLGLLVSLVSVLLQRRNLLQQARYADRQLNLRERASTAVEVEQGTLVVNPILAQQQLDDTLRAMALVDIRRALPLRLIRQDIALLLVAIALLVAAVLIPNPQADILAQQRAIEKAIAGQIEALEALQEQIQQNPDLTEEQKEELLQPLESAQEELASGDLSREGAVAVLSETEADLRELGEANSTEALRETLREAGQALADNPVSESLGEALQNGNFAAASSAMNQLADSLPSLSADELAALAEDLAATAAALQEADPELAAQLAQAAEALRNGDLAAAEQAMREAAATLQQRAQEQAAAQQAAAAAGELSQGRNEVAQAGQQDQGQGQPGQGQGQQSQGQQGQGDQQGQQGGQEGQGDQTDQGEGSGGPGPGGGHAENVYVPEYVDLTGEPGEEIELPAECIANPENCGALLSENPTEFNDEESLVPYDQVFGDYRDAAFDALDDGYVPLGLRSFIRDYFSLLEP